MRARIKGARGSNPNQKFPTNCQNILNFWWFQNTIFFKLHDVFTTWKLVPSCSHNQSVDVDDNVMALHREPALRDADVWEVGLRD